MTAISEICIYTGSHDRFNIIFKKYLCLVIMILHLKNALAIDESWVIVVHKEIDSGRLRYRDQLNTSKCSTQAATYFLTNRDPAI